MKRRNKINSAIITAAAIALLTGCQSNKYQQEAGVRAKWDDANPTNQIHVTYTFNPTNQTLEKIDLGVTNAVEVTLLDGSKLRSNSAASKSDMSAAGGRQGMLDNNTDLQGRAATESKLDALASQVASIVQRLNELKSPIPANPNTD